MENKRKLGQFYTDYNPFKNKVFKEWFARALKNSNNKVLEPFAGSNNLIEMLKEDFEFEYTSYDIEPTSKDVKKRDTLKNYPQGFDLAVTNPPYLSKVSAKRRGIDYPESDFSDLYKHCLAKMVLSNKYVAAIVPINVIRDSDLSPRIDKYVILDKKMFNTTEVPVCLAMFSPYNEITNPEAYTTKKKIGSIKKIDNWIREYLGSEINDEIEIKFNSKEGNLFLRAIDSPNEKRISFGFPNEMNPEDIKISSRHLTLIKVPVKVNKKMIEELNSILEEYRRKTGDIYLNAFMGLRKDGNYRRRLDYRTARKIIEKVIANGRIK